MKNGHIGLTALAAVCLAGAGAAQAQETAPCAALNRVIAAAEATPSWNGVARGSTGTVPLFGLTACSTADYSSSADYNCTADATATTVETRHQALVQAVGRCFTSPPQVQADGVSTYHLWRTPGGVEITTVKVVQPNADNYGLGLTVRYSF